LLRGAFIQGLSLLNPFDTEPPQEHEQQE
jgi:hypothetical protein